MIQAIFNLNLDPERFLVLKEQLLRGYKGWSSNSPYEHAIYYVNYRLQDTLWHSHEKISAIHDISVDSMRPFIANLFDRAHFGISVSNPTIRAVCSWKSYSRASAGLC